MQFQWKADNEHHPSYRTRWRWSGLYRQNCAQRTQIQLFLPVTRMFAMWWVYMDCRGEHTLWYLSQPGWQVWFKKPSPYVLSGSSSFFLILTAQVWFRWQSSSGSILLPVVAPSKKDVRIKGMAACFDLPGQATQAKEDKCTLGVFRRLGLQAAARSHRTV